MRKLFVGGNWKSNLTVAQVKNLVETVYNKLSFDASKLGNIFKIRCYRITNFNPFTFGQRISLIICLSFIIKCFINRNGCFHWRGYR